MSELIANISFIITAIDTTATLTSDSMYWIFYGSVLLLKQLQKATKTVTKYKKNCAIIYPHLLVFIIFVKVQLF